MTNLFFASAPLDQFQVNNFISLKTPLFDYLNLTVTNLTLYAILVLILIIGLHFLGNNDTKLVPSKWSIALETSFASLKKLVSEQIGASNEKYLPFMYSLFFFIIIGNLVSNVPYSFGITTSAILCMGLSFSIFIGVTILSLFNKNIKFFARFIPDGTPLALVPLLVLIETVSYCAISISLGVRIFANMVAGHTLLNILSTFLSKLFSGTLLVKILTLIPFSIFVGLIALELGVSVIQAYVFTLLVASYLKDAASTKGGH